ncbi:unnamed protein product [Periconia digitata]|uniref:Uncharacterized protein n=1 Tax=Periconia digitata TaxID=1303443 RepID=A0A9W4U7I7_9PLEO|nr:unnamed protein product [Periconia digitata]
MPPKISIVRHAQGYHNLTRDYTLHDPLLTPLGKEQCATLSSVYPHHATADLVLASPLRRTVQTASYSFGPTLARDEVPFVLVPELQEVANSGADTGTDAEILDKTYEEMFKGEDLGFDLQKIDRSRVKEGWNSKTGYWEYTHEALANRARDFRNWVFQRPEKHILVVTHGAIAHFLTEDADVPDPMIETSYKNCEVRDFVFAEDSTPTTAHLLETKESKEKRKPRRGEVEEHDVAEVEGSMSGQPLKVGA